MNLKTLLAALFWVLALAVIAAALALVSVTAYGKPLKSPRHAAEMISKPMAVAPAPKPQRFEISWDYPLPTPSRFVGFTVLYAQSVQGPYTPLLETRFTTATVEVAGQQGYFQVRSHEL